MRCRKGKQQAASAAVDFRLSFLNCVYDQTI